LPDCRLTERRTAPRASRCLTSARGNKEAAPPAVPVRVPYAGTRFAGALSGPPSGEGLSVPNRPQPHARRRARGGTLSLYGGNACAVVTDGAPRGPACSTGKASRPGPVRTATATQSTSRPGPIRTHHGNDVAGALRRRSHRAELGRSGSRRGPGPAAAPSVPASPVKGPCRAGVRHIRGTDGSRRGTTNGRHPSDPERTREPRHSH